MEVTLTGRARDYILERGGRLYLWIDEHGLLHADTGFLTVADDWESLRVEGVRVFIAPATLATKWHIGIAWFPWRRLDVTTNLTQSAGNG